MTVYQASIRPTIDHLVAEAQASDKSEQRDHQRYPYFQPVSLSIDGGGGKMFSFSAFSRDISSSGMGLLHNMLIRPGRATLRIHDQAGAVAIIPCEIRWCKPCGEGWFVSGVEFQD